MNRIIGLLAGLLMCAGGCEPETFTVTVIRVDAEYLVNEFKANEGAANAKYKGQLLLVSGSVREIGKEKGTPSDLAFLDLGSRARVRCHFDIDREVQFQGLKKDDQVLVEGICRGIHASFRERVAGESLDDKFKKLSGTSGFITLDSCNIRPPKP